LVSGEELRPKEAKEGESRWIEVILEAKSRGSFVKEMNTSRRIAEPTRT
jgi:hypothetical protein